MQKKLARVEPSNFNQGERHKKSQGGPSQGADCQTLTVSVGLVVTAYIMPRYILLAIFGLCSFTMSIKVTRDDVLEVIRAIPSARCCKRFVMRSPNLFDTLLGGFWRQLHGFTSEAPSSRASALADVW